MGVTLVTAIKEATKQHLEKIGVKEEDKVFLVITPNGFEHVYQTVVFPVHEFVAGSTRLDQLMHKLAGKLNSNEEFHCVLQRSEQQFDLMKQRYDKLTNPYKDHDLLHFVIHAHGFTHAFQSANIQVGDFLRREGIATK